MLNEEIWNLIAKKLSGEANPDELLELEKALRLDPDLHYSLQAIQDVWESNPGVEPGYIGKAFEKHERRLRSVAPDYPDPGSASPAPYPFSEKSRYRLMRPVLIVTGLLVLFLGIYYAVQPHSKPAETSRKEINRPSEVSTQYGSRTKLLLPDGTSVWLNSGRRLIYDSAYGEMNREVSLTGEAFFDVAKNKQKPFIIHTGSITIKVLGTAFNVKSYPGDRTIETSLIQGRIEVTFKNHSRSTVILHPNQKLIVENDPEETGYHEKTNPGRAIKSPVTINPVSHFGPDSLIAETAWVDNLLVFQDESFTDLAKKMERWYGIHIIIEDQSLDTLHFTGSFEKENIRQALTALQLLSKFSFTIQNREVHIQKTY
jgi:ferric-dicitrate binding protein FerR (iron transport regulator)